MKKFKEYIPTFLFVLFLFFCLVYYYVANKEEDVLVLEEVDVVPTLLTKLENNSIWCSTFQLIWNDLKEEVVKGEVVFLSDPTNQMVLDLNQETFKESDISKEYYYKKYGYMTPSLKKEIEENIKEKFNETSAILDSFSFEENSHDYFFYSMLVREFHFAFPFDKLNDKTFGITSSSATKIDKNVDVLYYNDSSHCAVQLNTKEGDEILLVKGSLEETFLDIYQELDLSHLENFQSDDTISIRNFDFQVKASFPEIEKKEFLIGEEKYEITKTLQAIEFKLDNTGGKVKSEAGMGIRNTSVEPGRHFDFTDNFTLFIKEKEKDLPYFAIRVDKIQDFR